MKIQTLSTRQLGRRFALGAVTLALMIPVSGPTIATAEQRFHPAQSNAQRGSSAPRADQKPAQPRLPWWKDPVVIKELSLTSEQSARIDGAWRKRENDMHTVSKEYEKQRDELNRLMAERKVGIDVIALQHDRVEAQRTILNKSRTVMIYQFSLILTPEQNTALKAYFDRNRRERR